MFTEFKLGDTVKVWPVPGLRVQAHANTPGRFLAPEGEEVMWSTWHFELARAGSIVFTDPTGDDGHRVAEHDDGSAAEAALEAHAAELAAELAAEKAKAAADAKAKAETASKATQLEPVKETPEFAAAEKEPIAMVGGKGELTVTTAEASASASKENA